VRAQHRDAIPEREKSSPRTVSAQILPLPGTENDPCAEYRKCNAGSEIGASENPIQGFCQEKDESQHENDLPRHSFQITGIPKQEFI